MNESDRHAGRAIKVLCITEDPDRPTIAAFLGMYHAGVDLNVICPPRYERRNTLREAGIRLIDIEFRGRHDREAIRLLRRELQNGGYDILHLFGNRGLQNGLAAARGLPIHIVAYRGIVGNVSFFSPISWMRFLNPRIDRIICVADAVRDYFLRMQPEFLRIPPERLVRIYKGHSLDWYRDPPTDLRQLGIPEEAFIIGCVANYRPRKGIEVLVEAMGQLPEQLQAHLLLVGRMNSRRLEAQITASPVRTRIHRVGQRSDAPALTAACNVFVSPSIKREGLSRSLIEAMAYGVPPITTDCGGSPELVIADESGLIVPVSDAGAIAKAIYWLYQNPELRQRMGTAARERIATHFKIEDTIQQTIAVYRELIQEV